MHSVEGKSNKTGLRWKAKTWTLEVLDLVIKAEAPDAWQKEAHLSATVQTSESARRSSPSPEPT
ncbi:hypothetical protein, partial [Duodenibacillus massiliensis]|uniref:hypothetical protein n=1 Tax=Duodenibacillus massiliensis TaxID=1852381 RepID=UPI00307C8D50